VVNQKIYFTPICRYVLAEEMGIEDHHLPIRYLPSQLKPHQKEMIYQVVEKGLRALGANFCTTHTEVFFDTESDNCQILEVAARGGGFRAEMIQAATGSDYQLATIESSLGIEPKMLSKTKKHIAVVEVFADKNGTLKEINLEPLKNREDINHITINKKVGEEVGKAINGKSYIVKFQVCDEASDGIEKKSKELLQLIRNSIKVD